MHAFDWMRRLLAVAMMMLVQLLASGCGPGNGDTAESLAADEAFEELATEASGKAPTCYGTSCQGQSPDSTGCRDDAVTVDTLMRDNVEIREKWSSACQAAWSYVVRRDGRAGTVEASIMYGPPSSEAGIMTSYSASATSIKSPMASYPGAWVYAACGRGTSTASNRCTSF